MPDVGEVKYKVKADTSGVESDIQKTESKISGLFSPLQKLGDKFSSLGKVATPAIKGIATAFVGLTTAAGGAITAVAKMGIDYNTQMQTYLTAFTTMLGDAEKANELTNNLKEMAASTPLAMTDLADASQILLAFGSTAEQLPNQLKRLGDVAQGNAQKLGTMATAFGRIQSNGYASLEEINMMIDQGFNPLNIIAEKTGETMAEVRARVSAGQVSFEELSDALETATNEGGQFYNAMENQSKTFEGQMSTLKDNVSVLTGTLTKDLFENLASEGLPKVNEWVDTLMNAAEEGGVEGAIESAGIILTEMITELLNGAPAIIETATSLVKSFLGAISDNGPQIIESGVEVIMKLIDGFLDCLPDLLGAIGKLMGALVESIFKINWLDVGVRIIQGIISGLWQMASSLVDSFLNVLGNALNSAKKFLGIASPSKKAEKEVGKPVEQGVAKGMEKTEDIEKASKKMADYAISSLATDVNYNLPDVGSYAKSLNASFAGNYRASGEITVPLYLDGREIARASAWWTGEQLSWEEM